MAASPWKRGTV